MKLLVLSYDRPGDLFYPGGAATEELVRAFPECTFRFLVRGTETLEDMLWADAVTGHPSREMLRKAPNIRWVHLQSAGVDGYTDPNIYANPEVVLTRTADVFSVAIAEHVLGMMLALNRNFPKYIRNQVAHNWDRGLEKYEVFGSTVLMIGTGSLASEIVKLLQPFGCKIIGVRRDPSKPAEGYEQLYGNDELKVALRQADYVINTLPLAPHTVNFLGVEEFAAMKDSAFLINVGRGKTVSTSALIDALQAGKIAGAALDVTEPEPLNPDSPLWDMENVLITPHSSGFSQNTNRRRLDCFKRQIAKFIAGAPLDYPVVFERGY